jgi:hypothetical protein
MSDVTGNSARSAEFITTGRLRQLQNVQNEASCRRVRSTIRYHSANQRAEFIMSAHPPALLAIFPADTAPMT